MSKKIPLVDLKAQYLQYKDEFQSAIEECLEHTSFIGGPDHTAFADEFAKFCGGGHVALCGSGTDALYLTILSLLGKGDGSKEILTVSHTFIATAEAILMAGYQPVFVDIDPETYVMCPDCLKKSLTDQSAAILPVHLYGQMAPMDRIMDIANEMGLPVIEDAAQAHGASWKGTCPGEWGSAACFSFYPGKNLGAWGDCGAVFTRDQALAQRISMKANHGRQSKYLHEIDGFNSRMDGLQAAVLRVKLRYLTYWNEKRRHVAGLYNTYLASTPATLPVAHPDAGHVYHLYVVQVEDRNMVLAGLKAAGIMAGIHYPVPLHIQPVYHHMGIVPENLPVTQSLADRILSLPIYPEITEVQVRRIADTLRTLIS